MEVDLTKLGKAELQAKLERTMKALTKKKASARSTRKARQTIIVVVPGGKISQSELNKIVRNPQLLDEDEADYQYSMAAIREGGKPIPLSKILKRYGRR